jgi:hypothetical protein
MVLLFTVHYPLPDPEGVYLVRSNVYKFLSSKVKKEHITQISIRYNYSVNTSSFTKNCGIFRDKILL